MHFHLFYLVKLSQIFATVIIILNILLTSQLCSNFVSQEALQQYFIDSSGGDFAMKIETLRQFSTEFGDIVEPKDSYRPETKADLFFSGVFLAWDSLLGYNNNKEANQPTENPTMDAKKTQEEKEQILKFQQCIQVSIFDYFGFAASNSSPANVLRRFMFVIAIAFSYILLIIAILMINFNCKELKFSRTIAVISSIMWALIIFSILAIDHNWDRVWFDTWFRPQRPFMAIFVVKFLSIAIFVIIILEGYLDLRATEIVVRNGNGYRITANIDNHREFFVTKNRSIHKETGTVESGFEAASTDH
ncbi:hypothetical protein Ddc_18358 [Ditylenchus destructor]|nr:hypothetical protein Ddc_18358 [Ditylenchus destructor]